MGISIGSIPHGLLERCGSLRGMEPNVPYSKLLKKGLYRGLYRGLL